MAKDDHKREQEAQDAARKKALEKEPDWLPSLVRFDDEPDALETEGTLP